MEKVFIYRDCTQYHRAVLLKFLLESLADELLTRNEKDSTLDPEDPEAARYLLRDTLINAGLGMIE